MFIFAFNVLDNNLCCNGFSLVILLHDELVFQALRDQLMCVATSLITTVWRNVWNLQHSNYNNSMVRHNNIYIFIQINFVDSTVIYANNSWSGYLPVSKWWMNIDMSSLNNLIIGDQSPIMK